jgi:electron transport complex protein RnfE
VKEWMKVLKNGLSFENPLTVLMIGLCSVLAVSSRAEGSFFMGVAVMFVLVMSNVIIAAIRHLIPEEVRIPIFIVIIASFVTIVDLVMKAYLPSVYSFLGVWIPLIVVNCIVLGRAEAFAYHNRVWLSVADGIGMGLGYTIIITALAAFRELFGGGQIVFLKMTLVTLPAFYRPPNILLLFPGAFMLFGLIVAGSQALNRRMAAKQAAAAHASAKEGM